MPLIGTENQTHTRQCVLWIFGRKMQPEFRFKYWTIKALWVYHSSLLPQYSCSSIIKHIFCCNVLGMFLENINCFYAAFLRNVVYSGRLYDYDVIPTRVNVEHTEIFPFVRKTRCSFFCCTPKIFQSQILRKWKMDLTSVQRMGKYQEIIIFCRTKRKYRWNWFHILCLSKPKSRNLFFFSFSVFRLTT